MRSPAMQIFINGVSQRLFGRIPDGRHCVVCGSTEVEKNDFDDEVSRREFLISGLCQKCQSETFV